MRGKSKVGDGRSIFISGASTGIGKACALLLDSLGFRIFAGVRKAGDADALRQGASQRLLPVFIDITDQDSVCSAAKAVGHAVGEPGLFGLVNNAGIAVAGPLEFLAIKDLLRQLEVNVLGQVAVTQAFLPLLRKSNGRIINMGSIAGRVSWPFLGPYSASKFALEAITDSLRLELKQFGISVSMIEPGIVATPIWGKSTVTAEAFVSNLPPEAHILYGTSIASVKKAVSKASAIGMPSAAAARAVANALTARRPKIRYLLGWDARFLAVLNHILPARMLDLLMLRFLFGKRAGSF